jgi:hypothetical protein
MMIAAAARWRQPAHGGARSRRAASYAEAYSVEVRTTKHQAAGTFSDPFVPEELGAPVRPGFERGGT